MRSWYDRTTSDPVGVLRGEMDELRRKFSRFSRSRHGRLGSLEDAAHAARETAREAYERVASTAQHRPVTTIVTALVIGVAAFGLLRWYSHRRY